MTEHHRRDPRVQKLLDDGTASLTEAIPYAQSPQRDGLELYLALLPAFLDWQETKRVVDTPIGIFFEGGLFGAASIVANVVRVSADGDQNKLDKLMPIAMKIFENYLTMQVTAAQWLMVDPKATDS